MTTRQTAQQKHERVIALVLEVDADKCANTYGVAPCTAAAGAGNECYNTWATCQDRPNFVRTSVTKKFCSRGLVIPGETVRPYVSGAPSVTPTEIVPSKGLAMRSQTQLVLVDEPALDHLEDPYAATRAYNLVTPYTGQLAPGSYNVPSASYLQSFTRASTATYVDGSGVLQTAAVDTPRFQGGQLLIEAAATNSMLWSKDRGNAIYSHLGSTVVVNAATGPDGTMTADKIVEDISVGRHDDYQQQILTAGWWCHSAMLRAGERSWAKLRLDATGSFKGAFFDLAGGVIGTVDTGYTATIKALAGGWYLCSVSALLPANTYFPGVRIAQANGVDTYAGDGVSGIYVSDAQIEPSAEPSSRIPTTTTAVTRAADVATVDWKPLSGTWWRRFMARNTNLVGRAARVRQGYVVNPWDWTVFQTSAYIIDAVRGPDEQGRVTLVLSDVLKLADRNVVPAPTSGKLQADLKAIEHRNFLPAAATSTTTPLAADASAVDGAYVGMELYIEQGIGAGQRRTITAYTGATRTCTHTAWAVAPQANSISQVGALSINMGTGLGAQYSDPATSGKAEYVRIGDEYIQYTAKSGDVLSWADTTYRAKWGTTASDHAAGDAVQLSRAWVNKRPWEVLRDIFVEANISAGYLDTTAWQTEDATWFNTAEITAIVGEPTKASDLASELLVDLNAVSWWDPVAQKVKLLANMPILVGASAALTDDNFIRNSVKVETLDNDRITSAALFYGLRNYTANRTESKNYLAGRAYADGDASSANEYGDTRPDVRYSRWFSSPANNIYASAVVARRVARLRDAPKKITFRLDPRDERQLGDLVTLSTDQLTDFTGAAKTVSVRVVKVKDAGAHMEYTGLTTGFKRARYAFIAPNGQPDYLAASTAQRKYAYIATTATGKMSNGDDGYYIQ